MPVLADSSSGNFLVSPSVGVMIWTLIAFGITLLLLSKLVFPRINDALAKRQADIDDSIDSAHRTRKEAEELLAEYRARLAEARGQSDAILARARQAAEHHEQEAKEQAQQMLVDATERAQREIEASTRQALQEIRSQVADLTILAAEHVTRKSLTGADQRRLVEDAIREIDFTGLSDSGASGN